MINDGKSIAGASWKHLEVIIDGVKVIFNDFEAIGSKNCLQLVSNYIKNIA